MDLSNSGKVSSTVRNQIITKAIKLHVCSNHCRMLTETPCCNSFISSTSPQQLPSQKQHQLPHYLTLPHSLNSLLSTLERLRRVNDIVELNPSSRKRGAEIIHVHLRTRIDAPSSNISPAPASLAELTAHSPQTSPPINNQRHQLLRILKPSLTQVPNLAHSTSATSTLQALQQSARAADFDHEIHADTVRQP
jgi:hypothetical protein